MAPSPWHARVRAATPLAVVLAILVAGSAGYVIRPGDTLTGISRQTGVAVADLRSANGITNPDRIYAGRTLLLAGGAAKPAGEGVVHRVAKGETLIGLAVRYRTNADAIVRANGLSNPHVIRTGQRLVIPGGASAVPAAAAGSRDEVGALLDATARRYGMSPRFVKAVAWQESGWNPHVVSTANAVGVMQVLPSTGRFVSENLVGRNLDLHKPADNVEAGVAFLRHVYRLAGGDVDLTLAGYYQGLRSVRENGMYADTKRYIANVKALRGRF
ncbi:MAG TPA: LysM peptidoglycan-binding domain-containing protein [Egibacteraceae bacterium]|jgi:N-acetylmuramoyl-L-alanine amidase|nr:LysM peptidoglycan-binding domain-containing protein [Egibacteraceae bacterium]